MDLELGRSLFGLWDFSLMYVLWTFYIHIHTYTCKHTHECIYTNLTNVVIIVFLAKMHEASSLAFNIRIYWPKTADRLLIICHLLWKAWIGSWIMNSSWGWELNEMFYFNQNIWELPNRDRLTHVLACLTILEDKGGSWFFFYEVILTPESLTIKTLAEMNICNRLVLLYSDLKCHILI